MELYRSSASQELSVVVDYAHTPDALEKALTSVREHCEAKLWCVFGCGGDRDQAKRPVMGAAAEKSADVLVITNDNPRSEDPQIIAKQIASGINGDHKIILDRAEAIQYCIENAAANDWIMVAGKGHETTQHTGDDVREFSDRKVVSECLQLGLGGTQ